MKEKPQKIFERPGQPTKLNQEISQAIISDVREHLSINFAAEANNMPRSTVTTWITRGTKDNEAGINSIYTAFSLDIKKARAEKITEYMQIIASGDENWRAIAWILERCCPEEFGRNNALYKQLLNDYKMLAQSLIDQNKGVNPGSFPTNTRDRAHAHVMG